MKPHPRYSFAPTMQLTDEQKRAVSGWIADGAKLSDVQQRLAEEFGIRLTYMEARFLVDDLKLVPQEKQKPVEPQANAETGAGVEGGAASADLSGDGQLPPTPLEEKEPGQPGGQGKVRVSLDQIMRPGALVSGKVTFSDGVAADWYLDQMGRFGLVPPTPGYRPAQEDLAEFRILLEQELARQGL